jgi:hypothetical protein
MLRRYKPILFVTALMLVLTLVGLTPLKFVQKLGAGCPASPGKQVLTCTPCIYNALCSSNEPMVVSLDSIRFVSQPVTPAISEAMRCEFVCSDVLSESPPLRC